VRREVCEVDPDLVLDIRGERGAVARVGGYMGAEDIESDTGVVFRVVDGG